MLSYRNKHKAHFRAKNLERHIVDQGMASLSKEARLAHEKAQRRAATQFDQSIARARKLAKKIRNLEDDLQKLKDRGMHKEYENSFYHGYARFMPIRPGNKAYMSAIARCHMTGMEMHLLVTNPDLFPNPMLVFDLWKHNYYITWEGK